MVSKQARAKGPPTPLPHRWLLCNSLNTHLGQTGAVWGQQERITID